MLELSLDTQLASGQKCPRGTCEYSTSPFLAYGEKALYAPGEVNPPKGLARLYLGVELETEPLSAPLNSDDVRKLADSLSGWAFFKRDGSIGYDGREIVTLPMTLEAHRVAWERFFGTKPHEYLSSWNGGRCGMHVHINRAGMSPLTQGKLITFINALANAGFITDIAGRNVENAHFCKIDPDKKVTEGMSFRKGALKNVALQELKCQGTKVYYSGNSEGGRYTATNISSHTDLKTIEARIFRGNIGKNGVFRNLEFLVSLVEYLSLNKAGVGKAEDWLDYVTWFGESGNYSRFPELYRWLLSKNYLFQKISRATCPSDVKLRKLGRKNLLKVDSEDVKADDDLPVRSGCTLVSDSGNEDTVVTSVTGYTIPTGTYIDEDTLRRAAEIVRQAVNPYVVNPRAPPMPYSQGSSSGTSTPANPYAVLDELFGTTLTGPLTMGRGLGA